MVKDRKVNILLVENDEGIRHFMQVKLFKDGFNVSVAANGLHALQILKSGRHFDLIISDMKMPGKSGLELLSEAKKLNIQTPFLMVTGYADTSKVKAAQAYGVKDILVKPIRHQELVDKIMEYINQVPLENSQQS